MFLKGKQFIPFFIYIYAIFCILFLFIPEHTIGNTIQTLHCKLLFVTGNTPGNKMLTKLYRLIFFLQGIHLAAKFENLIQSDNRFEIQAKRILGMVVFRLKVILLFYTSYFT